MYCCDFRFGAYAAASTCHVSATDRCRSRHLPKFCAWILHQSRGLCSTRWFSGVSRCPPPFYIVLEVSSRSPLLSGPPMSTIKMVITWQFNMTVVDCCSRLRWNLHVHCWILPCGALLTPTRKPLTSSFVPH